MLNKTTINIYSIATFILLVGSAIQFGNYIVARYFVPFISILFIYFIFIMHKKYRKNSIISNIFVLHILTFSLFIILSVVGKSAINEIFFDMLKLFLAFSFSFFIFFVIYYASNKAIQNAVTGTTLIVLFILVLDVFNRFSSFNYQTLMINFYVYKINSLFFNDSNAVGLFALFYFSIIYYYYNYYNNNNKSLFLLLSLYAISVCILLSFSRASIIALISLLAYNLYFKHSHILKGIVLIIILILVPFMLSKLYLDESGMSKINIFIHFWELFWIQDIRGALFGYGINAGNFVYSYQKGLYSHSLITMIVGQFGLIGLIAYLFFFIYLAILTNRHTLFIFIPAFVTGLSYLHPFLETLFVANGFILGIYFKNKNIKESTIENKYCN